jgi:pimeloyl-ACP methyl ester carboxylesterase
MAEIDLRHIEFNGTRLAYRLREGRSPTLLFLPGYASDMDGTKALALDAFAESRGLGMLRFDYSGTGSSEGEFEEGKLGGWLD